MAALTTLAYRFSLEVWRAIAQLHPLRGPCNFASLRLKAKPLTEPLVLWTFTAVFSVIYSLAVHHVLLEGNPRIGSILLSATDTNYIVSVLSQFYATLVDRTIGATLDALRWALAARGSGPSFPNFVPLSGATDLFVVAIVMLASGLRSWSGVIRLLLPVGSLLFGSVLKFKADFERYFIPQSNAIPVYAGLMPIDTRVLSVVPTSYMCLYFAGWIPSLLGNPKYAIPVSIDGCSKNCTSVFLPGGLEIARKVRPIVNATILEGGVFNGAEAIRVNNAPGLLLRFDRQEKFPFDPGRDCSYYGEEVNDTIQICIADRNASIAVTVLLSVTRQNATTTYSRHDLQIRKVSFASSSLSEAGAPQPLNRTQFLPIWDKIFRMSGHPSESETDRIQVRSLLYSLAWLLRLYADVFPDDPFTPLTHLQNFLAIPLQFSTVCSQFANYTVGENPLFPVGAFAMSGDMLTTAET
ncbi:hypothetical protein MMYC01_209621 [Madurella mycetomatis]|uniref:Uncharacterized protein n=1 Tax=Madurella mycetomatis TaxID=100816 RepID=A0A175VVI8_9PEZI|nr:hypothetical protein MMYC01_209621 [Madurella mycetomatis]